MSVKKLGRLALVSAPELEYCTAYHCAGDCGQPHNDKERKDYAALVLDTFDRLNNASKRMLMEQRADIERKARKQL